MSSPPCLIISLCNRVGDWPTGSIRRAGQRAAHITGFILICPSELLSSPFEKAWTTAVDLSYYNSWGYWPCVHKGWVTILPIALYMTLANYLCNLNFQTLICTGLGILSRSGPRWELDGPLKLSFGHNFNKGIIYRMWTGFGKTSKVWYSDCSGSGGPLAVLGPNGWEKEPFSELREGKFSERVIWQMLWPLAERYGQLLATS